VFGRGAAPNVFSARLTQSASGVAWLWALALGFIVPWLVCLEIAGGKQYARQDSDTSFGRREREFWWRLKTGRYFAAIFSSYLLFGIARLVVLGVMLGVAAGCFGRSTKQVRGSSSGGGFQVLWKFGKQAGYLWQDQCAGGGKRLVRFYERQANVPQTKSWSPMVQEVTRSNTWAEHILGLECPTLTLDHVSEHRFLVVVSFGFLLICPKQGDSLFAMLDIFSIRPFQNGHRGAINPLIPDF